MNTNISNESGAMAVSNIDELSQELKDQLQELPQEGKQIFVAAFNAAQSDGISEQGAREVAWNSVKNQYEKGSDGKWHARGEVTAQHNKAITSGGN
ncbi:cation transport regulator ChaB [Scytonema tolypothrichoides VB-61278]|nr:cation transport regulator ChaB [Scytonema tolypothrichoides VB-61278]